MNIKKIIIVALMIIGIPFSNVYSLEDVDIKIENGSKEANIIFENLTSDGMSFEIINRRRFNIILKDKLYFPIVKELKPKEAGLIDRLEIKYHKKERKNNKAVIKSIKVIMKRKGVIKLFERKRKEVIFVETKLRITPAYKTKVIVIEGTVYTDVLDIFGNLTGEELVIGAGESVEVGGDEDGDDYEDIDTEDIDEEEVPDPDPDPDPDPSDST